MADPVDEDHARVRPPRGGPLPQNGWEVADVVGDEDAPFRGRQREDLVVLKPFELWLLIEGADVAPAHFKPASNNWPRYVGVEEQPHRRRLLPGLKERVEREQLVERTPALLGKRLYLFRKALRISSCQP